eukprot:TRINITY_DN4539_c0_g1_i2.p1 TRINITY_DN4539_c0_g1~~TRINITY_DN4539_c0_g1_i2.p1  ORF type:complete len:614 (+),score=116.43 TRINITY_DN4539_c0_g1_i2:112-1953(+)
MIFLMQLELRSFGVSSGCSDRSEALLWTRSSALAASSASIFCTPKYNGGILFISRRRRNSTSRRNAVWLHTVTADGQNAGDKLNLQEYMISLDRPLGIRFAVTINGTVFVHSLKKGGNAESSRMVMVGDVLKKISDPSGNGMMCVNDFYLTMDAIKEIKGPIHLIFERPVFPFPIQKFPLSDQGASYNQGKVACVTWDKSLLAPALQPVTGEHGNVGFVIYSSKFLNPKGWKMLSKHAKSQANVRELYINSSKRVSHVSPSDDLVAMFAEEESHEGTEWSYGSFAIDEYMDALNRAEAEPHYNHSLGMKCTKITDRIHVGSCIQNVDDIEVLSNKLGITAILNLQSDIEQRNWGIRVEELQSAFQQYNISVVNCPIREFDSVDLRYKLPFAVGALYRLLRQNHHVLVMCTTALNRSPACVIAYMHWIQDVALEEAINFVMGFHSCAPDRPAIVWATWDLIAMVEEGNHKGPPTHVVQIMWNHGCREGEEVIVVGDFKGDWNELIRAVHAGGQKYVVDLRLPQGKYNYKFIVGGQWRHSTVLPAERDQWGNTNNVIQVGDTASVKWDRSQPHQKDPTNIKVIERPLTEEERFTLAYAARRIALSICPMRFASKK